MLTKSLSLMCAILSWVQSPLREEQGVTNTLLRELFWAAATRRSRD
jgi:hypothetical protein